MINTFTVNILPDLEKRKNYYDGKQDILKKHYNDTSKPCNKAVTNFCKNIVNAYDGYIASPGYISYSSDTDIEDVMDILRYNDYQSEDSDLLSIACIFGVAAELMFIDNVGKTRFRLIDPRTCFAVYDDTLTGDIMYFVRFYDVSQWDDSNLYHVDVYSDYDIRHYEMDGLNGELKFIGEEKHYFSQCPANVFYLENEESIFDCIISLQDAYNELISDEIDDYSAFVDAYLALTGVDADADDVASMKENRVLVLPEGANAQWITKNSSDTQIENMLKRLQESIYRIAQCPDFSSESFMSGVTSGVAIRYRLTGCETKAAKIAAGMKKALQRRIEIICGIASLKLGEDVFRDINIEFKRNIPEDLNTVVASINSLKGIVSDQTLLSQIPFVQDINAEIDRVKEQKKENMALYDFGVNEGSDEESDE